MTQLEARYAPHQDPDTPDTKVSQTPRVFEEEMWKVIFPEDSGKAGRKMVHNDAGHCVQDHHMDTGKRSDRMAVQCRCDAGRFQVLYLISSALQSSEGRGITSQAFEVEAPKPEGVGRHSEGEGEDDNQQTHPASWSRLFSSARPWQFRSWRW
jgi:hypothetical protein